MKILFLPFTCMPSGHHQVADALTDYIEKRTNITCKKVNILSSINQTLEQAGIRVYLKWIDSAPKSYGWIYEQFGYSSHRKNRPASIWGNAWLLKKMEQILNRENPDLIICTHGFSSYLMSCLKEQLRCQIPVINVYTDFFINNFWGQYGIDHHFASSMWVKQTLIQQGIPESQITVAGIPVYESYMKTQPKRTLKPPYRILISGGSHGLGDLSGLLKMTKRTNVQYIILCGNNQKLYRKLSQEQLDHVQPFSYVHSKTKMNELYDQADAIVTKPGGVTVSEALKKQLPIFVHRALPGQEEINLRYLRRRNIVFQLDDKRPLDSQIIDVLTNSSKRSKLYNGMEDQLREIEKDGCEAIVSYIRSELR